MSGRAWDRLLTDADRTRLTDAGFGGTVGMGERCAVLVIDVQNYMVGPPPGSTHAYPSACGPDAERALERLAPLLASARAAGTPVIYTRFEQRRDGSDGGAYARKREPLDTEGWCWERSEGAAIHASVAPASTDIVLVKRKPSAFFGTELIALLVDRGIDTVVVTGGSTANCVRATAVDSASYNFRTVVVEDCVFDRFELSHLTALFDLERQYADVVLSADVRAHLERQR